MKNLSCDLEDVEDEYVIHYDSQSITFVEKKIQCFIHTYFKLVIIHTYLNSYYIMNKFIPTKKLKTFLKFWKLISHIFLL